MRLIILFLTTAIIQVSASSYGQSVTLKKENASLKTVLDDIRKQTGYDFFYSDKTMRSATSISIHVKNVSLVDALEICFKDQLLTYTIESKSVTIKPKEPSFLDSMVDKVKSVFADTDVRGRVVDEQDNPLPNASIRVKGKSAVTNTNAEGEFEIKNVADDAVLLISFVGFRTLELPLKDAVMPLEIKLNVATGELEEVKVVYNTGYQELNKERATGSFVQIDKELFNRGVSTNVLDRILEVTSSLKLNNPANANAGISIRGFSTINANKRPLVVVDGFPYEEGIATNDIVIRLDQINPNDVESVTILRDAAAASIWGARSGNGVIVITTKKGKYDQKSSINFSSNINLTEKPRLDEISVISPMDAIAFEKKLFASGVYNQYDDVYAGLDIFSTPLSPAVELMLAARKKNNAVVGYNVLEDPAVLAQLNEMGSHNVRDDFSKYLLQTAVNRQYAFNISGGSEKMKYYSSVGYDNNLSSDKGNKNTRLNLNFNSSYRPIKGLELNAFLGYVKSRNMNNSIGLELNTIAPYTRLADEDGNPLHVVSRMSNAYRIAYVDTAKYPGLLDWHYRPLDELNNNDNTGTSYQNRFGGSISYEVIRGFNIVLNSQYIKTLSNTNNYQSLYSYFTRSLINRFMQRSANGSLVFPVPREGILDYSNMEQTTWNVRAQLNLNKVWNQHQVNALAGMETSENRSSYNRARMYGYEPGTNTVFTNMDFNTRYLTRASGGSTQTIPNSLSTTGALNRFVSYFANAGYTFANTYSFTASARFDASNFFGSNANQRITPLWSSGIGWDISKEGFYDVRWLPTLKLRATYGYNANMNNKGTPLPIATYSSPAGSYHNEPYVTLSSPPNPGLTWEKIKTINIGLDYSLFSQDRISGSIEYYSKKGINLIGDKLIEATVGVTSYKGNYANMLSQGLDLNLNTLNLNGRLQWNTIINFSYNTDKVTNYEVSASLLNSASSYITGLLVVGKPLSYLYSYRSAGLDPLSGRPRGYVNGEIVDFSQVINEFSSDGAKVSDLVYHGTTTPQMFGNVMNEFKYKNISLSFNVSYAFSYYLRRPSINYVTLFNNWGNAHGDYYKKWQSPGDEKTTFVPALPDVLDDRYSFYANSSDLVIKGDHIRLNDLRLSYDINRSLFKRLPFNNIRFFAMANQLGIVLWKANKQGIDPLNPDESQTPKSRAVAFGLNLNF